ncbi:MAG TPA: DUF3103 family protein [Luteibacter sp.]|uniref:DUF3103 family protein n=1 Tax=Luteibacter sp. TaxID=1886636 RepID=UPI002B51FC2F|nr:DUF3103 family protein [Luteibacter sp.]HVI53992.1 DUF3103 family protein [Luteibacter sp.]
MKRIFTTRLLGAMISLALPASLMAKDAATIGDVREDMARGVAALATDPGFDGALSGHLVKGKASLADVLRELHGPTSADEVAHLRDLERQAIELRGLTGALDTMIDLRVHGVDATQPLPAASFWTATISRDPVSGAKQVVAFDTTGAEHRYDLDAVPAAPMLIVESDSGAALRAGVGVMNATLQDHGRPLLQSASRSNIKLTGIADGRPGEQLTLLKSIYLTKDHEPNIEGDAEVFAIVSGVGADGKAQIITKDMPWLDHDKRLYTPGMDLINWTDYGTNYVNVQLFEEDGNTNFKELAEAVTKATGDLSLLIAPEAPPALIVAGVSKIAHEILKAMPSAWFENANDYIDSFYVIERGGNYGTDDKPLSGARGEAHIVLAPHEVGKR